MKMSIVDNLAGPHAEKISGLLRFMSTIEVFIFAIVIGVLIYAIWTRAQPEIAEPSSPPESTEKRATIIVGGAVTLTVLILTIFVGASYAVDNSLLKLDSDPVMDIEVTAHQWWWKVRYLNDVPSKIFDTANEIHVPVGRKVRFILNSSDVIHSLWLPNLTGKRDIIPGKKQSLVIQADREGVFQGRCAEFCGLQHAKMMLLLIVESKEAFEAWQTAQAQPAAEPVTEEQKHGREVFEKGACTICHVIRGTEAKGYSGVAPDLTHLKSRMTIGAGAALNSKGYLGGWIMDPHGIKPGVNMPSILLEPKHFQALLEYLETLK